MYAVISTGGKQYRFEQGDLIKVEALKGAVGDQIVFDEVLALGDGESLQVGTPLVAGAQVLGTIVEQGKGSKVTVLKFKRRKMYRRKRGHRQLFTAVKIDKIVSGGEAKAKGKADTQATTERDKEQPAKKTAKKPKVAEKKASSAPKAAARKTAAGTSSGSKKKPAASTKKTTTRKAAAKTEPGAKKTQE